MAWLYVPNTSESLASAPESDYLTSESDWRCQLLAQSVTSNGKHMPLSTWRRRCKRGGWMTPLFGMTSPPLTAEHGVDAWIGSLGESPASRIAWPDLSSGRMTIETYGLTQRELLEQSDPTRFFLKMWRESFPTIGIASGQTFKQWATALRKDCSRRKRSAHRTAGNGYSYWLTPTANSSVSDTRVWTGTHYVRPDGTKVNSILTHQVANWRTPSAVDGEGGVIEDTGRDMTKMVHYRLRDQAANWATPTKADGERTSTTYRAGNPTLTGQSKMFDLVDTDEPETTGRLFPTQLRFDTNILGSRNRQSLKLADFVRVFPTPMVGDSAEKKYIGKDGKSPHLSYFLRLAAEKSAYSHLNLTTGLDGHCCSEKCRRLNPLFVESLMGVPIGWTLQASVGNDYRDWETVWSRWWQLMRSALWSLER